MAAAVFLILFSCPAFGDEAADYAPDRILVKFNPEMRSAGLREGDDILISFPDLVPGLQVIGLPAGVSVEDAIAYYLEQPGVVYAEPDYYLTGDSVPQDPFYQWQWGFDNIGGEIKPNNWTTKNGYGTTPEPSPVSGTPGADIRAAGAWNFTKGHPDIIVAVADTGIMYTHPDFNRSDGLSVIRTNPDEIPDNGMDDDGNGYVDDVHGWDFYKEDNDPMDEHGHGTHCTGTIAAAWNTLGGAGLAPDVSVLPLRILNENNAGGTVASELRAIAYAESAGASVMSCSFGSYRFSQAEYDAIEQSSMLFVCAAGNRGIFTNNYYPACHDLPNVIAVAASDYNDQLSSFSNYGASSIDLAAPGDCIVSAFLDRSTGEPSWQSKSGTSMAVPFVSGTAALMLSVNPGLSAPSLKYIIADQTDEKPALIGKTISGGRLNATAAVAEASRLMTMPPQVVSFTETVWAVEGHDAVFRTEAVGTDLHYQWQSRVSGQWENISGAVSESHTISQASLDMDGFCYRCIVTNDAGSAVSGNMTLHVAALPAISLQPENAWAQKGGTATFSVRTAGSGASFQWQKRIAEGWVNISGAQSHDYVLENLPLSLNNSVYRCRVSNENGSVFSDEAILTVSLCPFVIYTSGMGSVPSPQNADPDGSVVLSGMYPAAPGYVFHRWTDAGGGTYLPGGTYTISHTITLTADMIPVSASLSENPAGSLSAFLDILVNSTPEYDALYDINDDGLVSGIDLILFQRYLSGGAP